MYIILINSKLFNTSINRYIISITTYLALADSPFVYTSINSNFKICQSHGHVSGSIIHEASIMFKYDESDESTLIVGDETDPHYHRHGKKGGISSFHPSRQQASAGGSSSSPESAS